MESENFSHRNRQNERGVTGKEKRRYNSSPWFSLVFDVNFLASLVRTEGAIMKSLSLSLRLTFSVSRLNGYATRPSYASTL